MTKATRLFTWTILILAFVVLAKGRVQSQTVQELGEGDEVTQLRQLVQTRRSFNASTGSYEGCELSEEKKRYVLGLLNQIEARINKVPEATPSRRPVTPRLNSAATTRRSPVYEIVEMKFEKSEALSFWLNSIAKNKQLVTIVPFETNVSFFIFEILPASKPFSYEFIQLDGSPNQDSIKQKIESKKSWILSGVYRYATDGGLTLILRK
jgi:hypothetical protein